MLLRGEMGEEELLLRQEVVGVAFLLLVEVAEEAEQRRQGEEAQVELLEQEALKELQVAVGV